VAFDNHPSHWLQFDLFKGRNNPGENGLAFAAYPKAAVTRAEMTKKLREQGKQMEASGPIPFSQIPMLEKVEAGDQTATKSSARS
jgi:hypothetical protein